MTFAESLDQLRILFQTDLSFDFSAEGETVLYTFPELKIRDISHPPPDLRDFPKNELSRLMTASTQKFFFDERTTPEEWDSFVLSASSVLHYSRDGGFTISEDASKSNDRFINRTLAGASDWLLTELIPKIKESDRTYVGIGLGEPGSGKSTLFKFLLNKNRAECLKQRVVFSRFEAMKFRDYCRKKKQFDKEDDSPIVHSMFEYLSFILLRDILRHLAYSHLVRGKSQLLEVGTWSSDRRIEEFLAVTIASRAQCSEADFQQAMEALSESLGAHKLDASLLWNVKTEIRLAIIDYYADDYDLVVIFDGLDFVSFEDSVFDRENFRLLRILVRSFALRGAAEIADHGQRRIKFSSIFLLRRNTYVTFIEKAPSDLLLSKIIPFAIGQILPRAAAINAVERGIFRLTRDWRREGRSVDPDELRKVIPAVDICMRYVAVSLALGHKDTSLLKLFNGNLRDCFRFMSRVTQWVISNGYSGGYLTSERPHIDAAIEYVLSGDARRTLQQRGYRLVEFLLFNDGLSFENSVVQTSDSARFDGPFDTAKNSRSDLRSNARFSGFIDNIFNFHRARHSGSNDAHCLLEKIRLLQVLEGGDWMTLQSLKKKTRKLFGYLFEDSEAFSDVVFILLKGGLIRMDRLSGETVIQRTDRAAVLINTILFRNVYLEHVFHKTLFPQVLILETKDEPRYVNPARWTLNSIRNVFCFLAYIRFVENNRANDVSVPDEYRIAPKIEELVWRSTEKILRRDHFVNRSHSTDGGLAEKALGEINRALDTWRARGVLKTVPSVGV